MGLPLGSLFCLHRYEELKSLAGGLEADANRIATEADKAYQSSLMLLSSLSRLTKTSFGSFEVSALSLWDQDIPFHSLCPPCCPFHSSALSRAHCSWPGTCHPIPHLPVSSRVTLDLRSSDPLFVFQGEAAQLKQDAAALLSKVDTYMAQYRQLQSRVGRWEEEIKKLLQRGEGERAVRHGLIPRVHGAAGSHQHTSYT